MILAAEGLEIREEVEGDSHLDLEVEEVGEGHTPILSLGFALAAVDKGVEVDTLVARPPVPGVEEVRRHPSSRVAARQSPDGVGQRSETDIPVVPSWLDPVGRPPGLDLEARRRIGREEDQKGRDLGSVISHPCRLARGKRGRTYLDQDNHCAKVQNLFLDLNPSSP
jgi:hypothetical protein